MTKRESNKLDKQIEAIFYARCAGVVIPILRIGEIFKAGRLAHAEGRDITAAVVDTTLSIAADLAVKS